MQQDKPQASMLDRIAIGLGGGSVTPGQPLTPAQDAQVAQGLLNAAQALLAMQPQQGGSGHDRFMRALGVGMSGLGEGVAATRDAQAQAAAQAQQRELNAMKLREAELAHKQKLRIEEIRKSMPAMSTFSTPKEYYSTLGQKLFNAGAMQQGLELLKLGAPTTLEEQRADILKEQSKQYKFYTPVYNAVSQLARLRNLLDEEGGAASYSAMISFIKNLDDSVVRGEEVATFGRFNGFVDNMQNTLNLASGQGFTDAIKDKMYVAAQEATKAAIEGYQRHAAQQGQTYTLLGLPPQLIFPTLNYDESIFDPRGQTTANPDDAVDDLYNEGG